MDLQGTNRWADMVSENSSTESVYVNFDVASASDEVLQADLEPEDPSSDVNDTNTVVVESETVVPQCPLEVKQHWEHEAIWFPNGTGRLLKARCYNHMWSSIHTPMDHKHLHRASTTSCTIRPSLLQRTGSNFKKFLLTHRTHCGKFFF